LCSERIESEQKYTRNKSSIQTELLSQIQDNKRKIEEIPAKPSEFGVKSIQYADKSIPVTLMIRCSWHTQDLETATSSMEKHLKDLGFQIDGIFSAYEDGKQLDAEKRRCLVEAAHYSKEHGTQLVTSCPSRIVRHPLYDSNDNRNAAPTRETFGKAVKIMEGQNIFTLSDPDSTPVEDTEFLSGLVKTTTGNNQGRPKKEIKKPRGSKKSIRKRNKKEAILLREKNFTIRKISEMLGVSKSTVFDWLKTPKK